ncbi:MAG: hypothetical protein OEW88_12825 [Gammaproteobacteria bacterium]|nr:hypothetical protein [Gammaproteobacteria bacterium]
MRAGLRLSWVALATGLLPLVVVHTCYLISVQGGHIPGCVPYLSGCTSISAAGRYGTAYFVFKGGMIPAAVIMATYWVLCRQWLVSLGAGDSAAPRAMLALGLISAAFLVLYTVYLGSKGDFYNLMRRYGVNVHLSFGVLAQILFTRELTRLPASARRTVPRWIIRNKLVVVGSLLALGFLSIPVGNFMPDKDRAENVIEWLFAALMAGYYLLTACAWRATGFHAALRVTPDTERATKPQFNLRHEKDPD